MAGELYLPNGFKLPDGTVISSGADVGVSYDAVLASSGGDYTKLSALASGISDGDSVYLTPGTYAEDDDVSWGGKDVDIWLDGDVTIDFDGAAKRWFTDAAAYHTGFGQTVTVAITGVVTKSGGADWSGYSDTHIYIEGIGLFPITFTGANTGQIEAPRIATSTAHFYMTVTPQTVRLRGSGDLILLDTAQAFSSIVSRGCRYICDAGTRIVSDRAVISDAVGVGAFMYLCWDTRLNLAVRRLHHSGGTQMQPISFRDCIDATGYLDIADCETAASSGTVSLGIYCYANRKVNVIGRETATEKAGGTAYGMYMYDCTQSILQGAGTTAAAKTGTNTSSSLTWNGAAV